MKKDEYPLFSVIIPQKNRAEYLIHTIKTCMIQDYPNFEIIVADDCSEDNSVEVVKELQKKDSRIKLIAHKQHVGMRDNFESALAAVRPGYVIALGGDDGLVPGCIWKMFEILRETGRQLLYWRPAYYTYPDETNSHGRFMIKRGKDTGVRFIKSSDFLNKIAHSFMYQTEECPMFYMTGVASTELVDRVKARSNDNCFYHCPTPDGFSGVVLAGEVEDYVFTTEPLSIVGTTTKSQGKNYMRTDEKSKKESLQFFNDSIRISMHKELASQPYSPLQTIMTADYLLTARDLPGWPGKFDPIDFANLIRATFKMLETSPFENDNLVREMKILLEISKQHNLESLFWHLLKTTKRRIVKKCVFEGFIITRQTYMFDGSTMGINNIYDACIAVPFAYRLHKMMTTREFFSIIKRSIKTIINSRSYQEKKLPQIEK